MTEALPRPRRRRWRRWIVACALVPLVFVAASPLWFPWLLRVAAGRAGIRIAALDHAGWSRVRFSGVEARLPGADLRVGRVELPQPLPWLWRFARGEAAAASPGPMLHVEDWVVRLQPGKEPGEGAESGSTASVLGVVDTALAQRSWIGGEAVLERGRVEMGDQVLQVFSARVTGAGVDVELGFEDRRLAGGLHQPAPGVLRAFGRLPSEEVDFELTAARSDAGWNLAGNLQRRGDSVSIEAVAGRDSWLPETARVRGVDVTLPLPSEYPGSVQARLEATWAGGAGAVTIDASGSLGLPGTTEAPPLSAALAARFTTNRVEIATLRVDSQILRLRLREPVAVAFNNLFEVPPAAFQWEARLEGLTGGQLAGRVQGTLDSEGNGARGPRARFALRGEDLRAPGVVIGSATAAGEVDWPRAVLRRFEVTGLGAAEAGDAAAGGATTNVLRVSAEAAVDLERREVVEGAWSLEGVPPVAGWVSHTGAASLTAAGSVRGPLTNLVHDGEVRTVRSLGLAGLRPLDARFRWRGTALEVDGFELTVSGGEAGLTARGRVSIEAGANRGVEGEFSALDLREGDRDVLRLLGPVAWGGRAPATNAALSSAHPTVHLGLARWKGEAGELSVEASSTWPERGRVSVQAVGMGPAWLNGWRSTPLPVEAATRLHRLALDLGWDRGPAEGRLDLDVETAVPEVGTVRATASVQAAADGIRLREGEVTQEGKAGPQVEVFVPVVLTPVESPVFWRALDGGSISGFVEVGAQAWPWALLSGRTSAEVVEPHVRLNLAGTMSAPEVHLVLGAAEVRVTVPGMDDQPVVVERPVVRARGSLEEVVLEELRLRIEGQETTAEGRVPWRVPAGDAGLADAGRWEPDLARARGRVDIPGAQLTPLTRPFRDALAPGGELRAQVEWVEGSLAGWVEVSNVTTRAIAPVGVFREVALRLAVKDREVSIEHGRALLSGQPLSLSGRFTLPDEGERTADVRVTATNLAVVRLPEAMLRADLDLTISRTNRAAPPLVGGTVSLRDSVVMVDVRKLVAVDLERPQKRPPFFAVEQAPLADWGLDLRVHGERFARVLSPMFRGSVSADLRLRGSLGQPRLVGQGYTEGAQLAFPFGQLRLQQARVLFTEADPFRPRLEGRAEGLSFGYTIGMDLGGTLEAPEISFTSVPPMSTREVLQMLMAGTLPKDEYSFSTGSKAQKLGSYLAGDMVSGLFGTPGDEPRLTFQSGQRVASDGRLTYGVEYRLSDRWSAVAEYDRWNQVGAGVRWRILER